MRLALVMVACAFLAAGAVDARAQPAATAFAPALRAADFAGQWSGTPGGPVRVEIRVTGVQLESRELFTGRDRAVCGTVGRGQIRAVSARVTFRGRCQDGRTTPATTCTVRLETRDRLLTTCQNGHRAVLHRTRG